MREMDWEVEYSGPVYSGMERVLKLEIQRLQAENTQLSMRVIALEGQLKEKADEC